MSLSLFAKAILNRWDTLFSPPPAIKNQDYTCSSTIIRSLILQGKIKEANQILGRNFSISSRVVNGKKLAKQIGFPTANLKVNPYIIKPKFGVYKTSTYIPFLKQKINEVATFNDSLYGMVDVLNG